MSHSMEHTFENSSNVDRISYDPDREILTVHFLNGSAYQYFSVPLVVCEEFVQAESAGKFLNKNIKGLYRYEKM